jgi:hypothetical protein
MANNKQDVPAGTTLHFVQFTQQFSLACRVHGHDYCRVLPEHKPPKSLLGIPPHRLHTIITPKDTSPFPVCCQQAITTWKKQLKEPERECCLASVNLCNRHEAIAEGLRPDQECNLAPCCKEALKQYRWWRELEEKGCVKLGASDRYSIVSTLYNYAIVPRKPREKEPREEHRKYQLSLARNNDQLISSLAYRYVTAGGSSDLSGRNYEVETPFAAFLTHIWPRLEGNLRLRSPAALVARARRVVEGFVGWARVERVDDVVFERRQADPPYRMQLRVIAPKTLRRENRKLYSCLGQKIGERFSVQAFWDYDEKGLLPVNEYWSNRLRDGSVKLIGKRVKRLKARHKGVKSPIAHGRDGRQDPQKVS